MRSHEEELMSQTWRASRSAAPRKKQMEPPPKPTPVMMLYW
jgi:hypothetical protein